MKTNNRMGVVLSDVHCPFEDKSVCRMALAFIREHRPATIHLLGDIADFYSVSRFTKDPSRKEDLQADLDATRDFLAKVRDAAPSARIVYSEGNHEFRLRRYLASEAKALAMLRDLRLERLLDFDSLRIRFQPQDRPYRVGSLLFTHGQVVRKWSGASARGHFEKYGCCVIAGHTHRLGAFYHRDINDTYAAWENGCLCNLNPDYVVAPDWQSGWSVVWSQRDYFHVEQVAVVKGRYNYHGKVHGRKRLSPSAHFEVEDIAI
jgi:UDP-2,3-diacylglucosamine pyrophosphatase LpxH